MIKDRKASNLFQHLKLHRERQVFLLFYAVNHFHLTYNCTQKVFKFEVPYLGLDSRLEDRDLRLICDLWNDDLVPPLFQKNEIYTDLSQVSNLEQEKICIL